MNKIAVFFRKYGHKMLTFFIGLAFLTLCVFLLVLGGNKVYHMFKPAHIYEEGVDPDLIWAGAPFDELNGSGLEEGSAEYFEQYIANFVKQDFPSFSDPVGLNTDYFISYGIWQAIKVNGQGVYAYNKDGSFLIPKSDVEKFARFNFNYNGKIAFRSVDICGSFTYDKLSGCYKDELSDGNSYLVPDVIDIQFDGETGLYTLLVDCYYDDGLSEEDVTQDRTKFSKRISITLQAVEEIQMVNDTETLVTNYQYTSCTLVDETAGN